ncbi:hypothetical protein [Microbacterium sp. LWO12-1.2]|uniref:hypothetical protein n=1 Tax=Microbacterium sp. LWO12-1.2 TaxID=3135261 RepID=UPI003449889C
MSTNIQQSTEVHAFQEASFIIDESAVAEKVRYWLDQDGQHPELSDVDIHNVLSGWLGTALTGLPLTEGNVVRVLRTSPVKYAASEEDVRELTEQVLGAMDPLPLPPRDKPMTKSEFQDLRMDESVADGSARKRERFVEFTNAILRAQRDIADSVDDSMSVALGSVFRTAGVDGVAPNRYRQMSGSEHVSLEPDAGFVTRNGGVDYGWEFEVATLVSSDVLRPEAVPNIVVGVVGHRPGVLGHAAPTLINELLDGNLEVQRVTGDLAYLPHAHPDLVQRRLREYGAELVMEYSPLHEGKVLAASEEAALAEGTWYRKDMPDALRTAMSDFREASKANRSADGSRVLSADVQQRLEERRDALLDARRKFQVATPSSESSKYEQDYAYGSAAWSMAFTQGRYANTQFEKTFRDRERTLTPPTRWYSGETAHGFFTTLIVAATNAQLITEWELYHSLDEGRGLMVDEWYAMYQLLVPRIQEGMARWSRETQPHDAGAYWNVDNDEDTCDWRPDGAATVVEFTRATDALAESVADALLSSLRSQAQHFLNDDPETENLSREARIELAVDFVDANRHGGEEGTWLPVPAGGALLAAEATLIWSEL